MDSLFAAGTALVVSLAVIPLMTRLAPRLRLLDEPNARKVHAQPIPRVGGWGIAVGTLLAILLWLPLGPLSLAFVYGGAILSAAGAADDIHELPGYLKLTLQLVAVVPLVVLGDLAVDILPLGVEVQLPYAVAAILTIAGLITCINATNTSDGLDGLAAGATLLSLFGLLYIAYVAEANQIMVMIAAALGGLIGFLRYNTHPAIIFMGDLGSQFLGLAVGFLGIALIKSNTGYVSPFALLLVLGLPLADIVVVAVRRIVSRAKLFEADKSHIHHRFLDLGLTHGESVVLFYMLQGSFVLFGITLQSSNTWKVLLVYALHFAIIYGSLSYVEAQVRKHSSERTDIGEEATPQQALLFVPRVALETVMPLLLVTGVALATSVPMDFGILGAALLVLLVARLLVPKLRSTSSTRIMVFLLATAVLYLFTNHRPFDSTLASATELLTIAAMGLMAFAAVKFSPKRSTGCMPWW